MQTFLAIDIPKAVKNQIEIKLEGIKKEYPNFRWIPKNNYHITIHYLGLTNDLSGTIRKIKDALYDIESCYLYSLRGDLFIHNQIVLFISFKREKKVEELVLRIKQSLEVGEKRKFSPHLIIARYKIPSKQQYLSLKKKLHKLDIGIHFPVKKIYLFQSLISNNKPIYKKLHSFFLV